MKVSILFLFFNYDYIFYPAQIKGHWFVSIFSGISFFYHHRSQIPPSSPIPHQFCDQSITHCRATSQARGKMPGRLFLSLPQTHLHAQICCSLPKLSLLNFCFQIIRFFFSFVVRMNSTLFKQKSGCQNTQKDARTDSRR